VTGKDYSGETTVKKNNGSKDVTSVLLNPVAVNKTNIKAALGLGRRLPPATKLLRGSDRPRATSLRPLWTESVRMQPSASAAARPAASDSHAPLWTAV
jgi:hypothetical protein